MLSGKKLKACREAAGLTISQLAEHLVRSGLSLAEARSAVRNWEQGLLKPEPTRTDEDNLARALQVSRQALVMWSASHRYAPMAPRKVRLVADLIRGLDAQDALDVLQFTNKRAAVYVRKVLQSAIANADEQEVSVAQLYVVDARVDGAGIRPGTRRWRPKDRGRAMPWTRHASHIHVAVDLES